MQYFYTPTHVLSIIGLVLFLVSKISIIVFPEANRYSHFFANRYFLSFPPLFPPKYPLVSDCQIGDGLLEPHHEINVVILLDEIMTHRKSHRKWKSSLPWLLLFFIFIGQLAAQQTDPLDDEDLFEMSLEELMEIEISVASRKATTRRESPGIVTVITRDEIQKSGARDLVDILKLVPGFDVGFDTAGAYGVAIRGIWANEGKVLVLMDGVPLNDEMYGTFQYGHHIPVDVIERIEIMRGPGSAMYGDSAELGVISIKTIKPTKENDVFVSTTYSRMEETFGSKNVTTFYGTKKDDFSLSIISHYGRGNFTDRTSDNYDASSNIDVDLGENHNSLVTSPFFNISAKWGNLSLRAIIDRYHLNSPWPTYSMYEMKFYSDIYQLKYEMPITDNLSLNYQFLYKHQKPWNYEYNPEGGWEKKLTSDKYTSDAYLSYDLGEDQSLVVGGSYDEIKGWDKTKVTFDRATYDNKTLYGEGFFKTPFGDLTLGGRYVDNSYSGSDFVPRIALVKVFDNFHIKALYSEAYRSPNIMNIAYNSTIKPEKTTTYELEVGSKVTDNLDVSINAFDVLVTNPIVYYYSGTSNYANFDQIGSRGIEFSSRYKKGIYDIGLTYAWYEARDNKVTEHAISGEDDMLLGFASHKVSLYAAVNPADDLYITPTVTYYSPRHAITGSDGSNYLYEKLGSSILTNISLLKKNAFDMEGLDMSFTVSNIFNENFNFIEPYQGGYGPIPGPPRTFIFSMSYSF